MVSVITPVNVWEAAPATRTPAKSREVSFIMLLFNAHWLPNALLGKNPRFNAAFAAPGKRTAGIEPISRMRPRLREMGEPSRRAPARTGSLQPLSRRRGGLARTGRN